MKALTNQEELLVELVHYLTFGSDSEQGLPLKEVQKFLITPISSKDGKTPIECLRTEGRAFINELKIFMNETEGFED